jgi:hypothetical protein
VLCLSTLATQAWVRPSLLWQSIEIVNLGA